MLLSVALLTAVVPVHEESQPFVFYGEGKVRGPNRPRKKLGDFGHADYRSTWYIHCLCRQTPDHAAAQQAVVLALCWAAYVLGLVDSTSSR